MSLGKNTSKPIPQLCSLQTPKNNWPILPISSIYYGYGSNLQASNVGLKSRYTPKCQYLYKAKHYMRFDHGHLGYPISDKPIYSSFYTYMLCIYIYDYICRYIYIYMVIRSVLLFRWSLKFDLVWSQVATSQRPQPTNYCCGQESQKCPTCPFSEYELVVLCSDFRQMIQSPVLHNSSPYKNVRWLAEEMHRWLACTRLIAKVPAGSPG